MSWLQNWVRFGMVQKKNKRKIGFLDINQIINGKLVIRDPQESSILTKIEFYQLKNAIQRKRKRLMQKRI